jgi:hypothetical protein
VYIPKGLIRGPEALGMEGAMPNNATETPAPGELNSDVWVRKRRNNDLVSCGAAAIALRIQ